MKNLNITVANKVATYCQRDGFIVCGNSDYQITFTFDSEWDAHTVKTARFKWNGNYTDVVFSGNVVSAPIISDATQVEIGVFAGDLCTTTPAVVPCIRSILCGDAVHADPTPDVYTQLLGLMEAGMVQGPQGESGKDGADGKDGVDGKSAYEIACDNGFEGTEEEWLASLSGSANTAVGDLKELINTMINYCMGVRYTTNGSAKASSLMGVLGYGCTITMSVDVPSSGTIADVTLDSFTGGYLATPNVSVSGNTIKVNGEVETALKDCTATVSYRISPNIIGD